MKLVFWLFVAVAACYGFYSASMAAWAYLQVSSVVQQAAGERYRGVAGPEGLARIRDTIVRESAEGGVPLDARDVEVVQHGGQISVRVRWTYPVIVYEGETVLAIPLSVDRSYAR